ncbi:MAG TPA: methylated-DNA--[protein]-cysteine S-methyltransferase [Polyangiales bacterium]|jgi:methylated-DNA-[protein]-cysteine S-methyltransferase|nr:methylated-DNA--[protein]-cysteine S-methyltransferase [Polyangiales bacterium]
MTTSTLHHTTFASPLGALDLYASDGALVAAYFAEHRHRPRLVASAAPEHAVLRQACEQLHEYFCGARRDFSVPLAARGTAFQHEVWRALRDIPFGAVRSYAELARAIARPEASRAVGAANGRNPLSIFVPCHRVIGSSGELTGYAGGLAAKRWLLEHERGATSPAFKAAASPHAGT